MMTNFAVARGFGGCYGTGIGTGEASASSNLQLHTLKQEPEELRV